MGKGKNKGGLRFGPGRQQKQPVKQSKEPQVSPEDKMTLEEAKEIIQNKEDILTEAKTEADAIREEAQREKAAVETERSQLDAEKAEFAERAETLRKDHESQAILDKKDEIIANARLEADEIIDKARKKADKDIEDNDKELERRKAKAQSEADDRLKKAQADADKLILEARAAADDDGKRIRDKAREQAEEILKAAHEQERAVIDGKEAAAQVRADDIIAQANAYAQKTRTDADQYRTRVRSRADSYEADTRANADKKAQETVTNAEDYIKQRIQVLDTREQALDAEKAAMPAKEEERIQKAIAIRKAEMDRIQEQQAKREAELNDRQQQLEYDTRLLNEERAQYNERVKRAVEMRYNQVLIDLETQKELTNQGLAKIRDLEKNYKEAKSDYWLLKSEKPNENAARATAEEAADLKKEKRKLESLLKKYMDNGITESRIQEFLGFEAENRQLREQISQLQQDTNEARIAANGQAATADQLKRAIEDKKELEKQVRSLREELDAKKVSRVDMISPIQQLPASADLQEREEDPDVYRDEVKWLDHIKEQADASGIKLPRRQYMAYHTSLKIREWSPMVVLAGVSGTGKSELPRQYAVHGGMRFVSVPVKPDWDSPSSLFGYYNTIENKFEATELLRYLYQMQSRTGIGTTGKRAPWGKDMLVVLLDEMNLAHPEQYFADMLSKFEEARGSSSDPVYDIALGAGEPVEPLRIGRNVLWTGTMNEDETTKGLSDKVIDRSMLITFPRPAELLDRPTGLILAPEFRTTIDRWNEWLKGALKGNESILPEELERLRKIVEEINSYMGQMGRNLGHRVWQSMQHYILNYPQVIVSVAREDDLREAIKMAFCDAIAFKVMPKFRGLEVEGRNRDQFDKIGACLAANVPELLRDFEIARSLSSEVFQWSSAEFMNL